MLSKHHMINSFWALLSVPILKNNLAIKAGGIASENCSLETSMNVTKSIKSYFKA